jgi:hypothetical protein
VVFFLVSDVVDHSSQLGVGVRKRAEALLPREPARMPVMYLWSSSLLSRRMRFCRSCTANTTWMWICV